MKRITFYLYPYERQSEKDAQLRMLSEVNQSLLTGFIAYTTQGLPVGYILGMRKNLEKVRHTMHMVIAIQSKYFGKGYAKLLLQSLEQEALSQGVTILRLSVMTHNSRAINFYKNLVFRKKEGSYIVLNLESNWYQKFLCIKPYEHDKSYLYQ